MPAHNTALDLMGHVMTMIMFCQKACVFDNVFVGKVLSGKMKWFKVYDSKQISGQVISKIWPEKYDCLTTPTKQYAFIQLLLHVFVWMFFSVILLVFHFCMQSVIIFTIATCKKRNRWKIWLGIKTSQ